MGFSPVWFYVPNLIGYFRVLSGLAAFWFSYSPDHWHLFFLLYFVSYSLDAVDGVAARALKQMSKFGAVLDMITDRFCTAVLLSVLAHHYPSQQFVFTCLMILDIVSHWVQMYSSLASGSESHKNLKDEWPILRFYYTAPYALFWVCTFNETFLAFLFLAAHGPQVYALTPSLVLPAGALFASQPALHAIHAILALTFPVFFFKQFVSVVQLCTSAGRIVALDDAAHVARTSVRSKRDQ